MQLHKALGLPALGFIGRGAGIIAGGGGAPSLDPLDPTGNLAPTHIWDENQTYDQNNANQPTFLEENLFGIYTGAQIHSTSNSGRLAIVGSEIAWATGITYQVQAIWRTGTSGEMRINLFNGSPAANILGRMEGYGDANENHFVTGGTITHVSDVEIDEVSGARLLTFNFTVNNAFTKFIEVGSNSENQNVIFYGMTVKAL